MIGKARAIAHGIQAIRYASGESRNKKHPDRIIRICDSFIPQGMDAMGIWNEMELTMTDRPYIRNNTIRIEISPAKEHTENFTRDDWQRLWRDFAEAFDRQTIHDKNGKVISNPTNISFSKSTVWLHRESKSGIPHLHAIVCRLDENGNINNDHQIARRAQQAAETVALQRGWTTARSIHEENIKKANTACMDVLRMMHAWSWEDYAARLKAKGYDVHLRKDRKGIVRGYVLTNGNARYKASELGRGRNLMASSIEETWRKMHPENMDNHFMLSPRHEKPEEKETHTDTARLDADKMEERHVHEEYREWKPDRHLTEITHDGETYRRYIPEEVQDYLDEEFDHRETGNWKALQNLALAFFTLIASPYQTEYAGGGGGTSDDKNWGRDRDEDELEFACRCVHMASKKLGRKRKAGFKR